MIIIAKKKTVILISSIILSILFIYHFIPFLPTLQSEHYSTIVKAENGEILRIFLNEDEQWCFPPDPNFPIPQKLKNAVLYYEDRYFYRHPGINPVALIRALFLNLKYKQIISGGSTITMQVSRLTNPKPRTYWNKLFEIFQAFKLEIRFSKDQILRMYLDYAPYGGNIIGFQAASLKYFRKLPEQLTWSEAAILAVLPNSPSLISPSNNQEKLIHKRNRLLKKLFQSKIIDQETYTLSLKEPVPNKVYKFEMKAPHLAQHLKNQTTSSIIRTTINKVIQQNVQNIIKEHAEYLQQQGICNIAAIVVETESGKVRAYVGSQNFLDTKNNGQVDGIMASRSTGSILKPFLYALSFDAGIILPQTLIKDVPSYFGPFSPTNANQKFDGLVSAREALIRSLNVPAVRLLKNYGIYKFYHFLQTAGMSTLFRSSDDYGLTLIIGGSETTLLDLAMLYRGLGNQGKFKPLQIIESESNQILSSNVPTLISPCACYLTLDILKETRRPGCEYYWHQYENQWPLAWKTGTSYGQRDAWAVGVNPDWTIAIWVGNFTGEGNPSLSGASCAGPILFDIFNSLPKDPSKSWFQIPLQEMNVVDICKETGFLAGQDCPEIVSVLVPYQMKPMKICPYHKSIYLTNDEKYQVCSLCWEPGNYKKKIALIYPPDVVQYLRERGQTLSNLPEHKKDCPGQMGLNPLEIIYPTQNARLWIPRDMDGFLQKVTIRLAHRAKKSMVYWYLDDEYIGFTQEKHVKAIKLTNGKHYLEVIDENGNQDKKKFYVEMRG